MSAGPPNRAPFEVAATYGDQAAARAARARLQDAGIDPGLVSLSFVPITAAAAGEGRFLGRLVWVIVLWSVVGGVAGAALALLLAWVGVGPSGSAGFWIQFGGWVIFGHLLAGMWAGYVILSGPEARPERERRAGVTVSVRCASQAEMQRAEALLSAPGAHISRRALGQARA